MAATSLMLELERAGDRALPGRQAVLQNEILRAHWRTLQRERSSLERRANVNARVRLVSSRRPERP
jgi:hypothetical protein